jgi:hypothetical protein
MLDIEPEIYELIQAVSAAITWSPGFPQSFAGLTSANGIGSWKVRSNANSERTSSRREWISEVEIEIQTWAATPELRSAYDQAVDAAFGPYFIRTAAGGHFEERLVAEIMAFRSVLVYRAKIRDDYQIV